MAVCFLAIRFEDAFILTTAWNGGWKGRTQTSGERPNNKPVHYRSCDVVVKIFKRTAIQMPRSHTRQIHFLICVTLNNHVRGIYFCPDSPEISMQTGRVWSIV
ncbi:hypothetical protein OUZ56_015034 [Daphnia magna]|uniref:Secreted protein n=1 Tax=Daphnia magna TaxID=35525 RepID=A0ABR0ALT7_9CRUS|nr:hypothetical protein OUZ56_015034 [Daphnia magna]